MPTAEVGVVPLASQPDQYGLAPLGTLLLKRNSAKSLAALVAVSVAPDWECVAMDLDNEVPLELEPGVRQVALW